MNDETWHKKACDKIRTIFKDMDIITQGLTLTYGQAQKWLNMALKNMWLLGLIEAGKDKYLHIPIDNYIIKAACTCEENPYFLGVEFEFTKNNKDSWSSWNNYDEYWEFQNKIHDAIYKKEFNDKEIIKFNFPIQWENAAWIEQAMIEANG